MPVVAFYSNHINAELQNEWEKRLKAYNPLINLVGFFYSLTYFFFLSTDHSFVPLATINKNPPAKPTFFKNKIN